MNYPFWDVKVGYGLIMAAIAVVHVFISHFAIGGGLYLVLHEKIARKNNDLQGLEFLKKLSKFFILLTLVAGALTGVGIWFVIGLISPQSIEVLIHHFVWAWAIEWTFFVTEIISAIIYFYGWQRMSAKHHMIIGWIYFVSAWMSLFVINGIITFMLTPGDWITTGAFWDGFFNPTFWPSLVFRTGISAMLAGFFALLLIARYQDSDFKRHTVRINSLWSLAGLAIMGPSLYWYWKAIPAEIIARTSAAMTLPLESIQQTSYFMAAAVVLLVILGVMVPKQWRTLPAVLLMILGFVIFGRFEYFRESVRKPYIISNYMYANSLEVSLADSYQSEGYLRHMVFRTGQDGADLFRHLCNSCHTMNGYHPLKEAFDGTDKGFITSIIKGIRALKGNMPPFFGTDEEASLLANYIYQNTNRQRFNEIYKLQGVELGHKVYQVRCGTCHVLGGYRDKTSSLLGLDEQGYSDLLDMADDLGNEMPAFTGDATEKAALIEFLKTLKDKKS